MLHSMSNASSFSTSSHPPLANCASATLFLVLPLDGAEFLPCELLLQDVVVVVDGSRRGGDAGRGQFNGSIFFEYWQFQS